MDDALGSAPRGVAICAFSGFKVPVADLVRNWDGQMVDKRFVDKRNPQDFVRGVKDDQRLPVSRPEPEDVFLGTNEVTPDSL